ncbi:MAG: isoquinoline 1-oxidoreductase beta subunit, partial [Candidatus Azotimanducaceae bacterium]
VAYRLSLLANNTSLVTCLERVAEMAQWGVDRRHLGVACLTFGQTQIAMIIEVKPHVDGFEVKKAWCAIDCGIAVNPNIVKAQVEGGLIDGLSASMFGRLEISGGAVQQSNFPDYPLARMGDSPTAIDVDIVASMRAPSGVGEAALPAVAPALANALFHMTGQRIRKLPFCQALESVL